ncbi:MAG: metalloregulator ArsR/SmtB family transcription factor [Christensenellaceae bacterium]|nr:metalloregulator ArsR/SmtB family transcription factor [Christensenellaceae bacterium]
MPILDVKTQTKVKYYVPDNDVLTELSDLFSVLSDSTRIKILSAVCISEMCVSDLSEILDINQTTVSHQLKILRSTGIVNARRDGKTIYYSLANRIIPEIMRFGTLYLGYY